MLETGATPQKTTSGTLKSRFPAISQFSEICSQGSVPDNFPLEFFFFPWELRPSTPARCLAQPAAPVVLRTWLYAGFASAVRDWGPPSTHGETWTWSVSLQFEIGVSVFVYDVKLIPDTNL